MLYEVRYKKVDGLFWKKIKNIEGDGFIEGNRLVRFFVLDDKTQIEISCEGVIFKFNSKRFYATKKQMESETGQSIPTK